MGTPKMAKNPKLVLYTSSRPRMCIYIPQNQGVFRVFGAIWASGRGLVDLLFCRRSLRYCTRSSGQYIARPPNQPTIYPPEAQVGIISALMVSRRQLEHPQMLMCPDIRCHPEIGSFLTRFWGRKSGRKTRKTRNLSRQLQNAKTQFVTFFGILGYFSLNSQNRCQNHFQLFQVVQLKIAILTLFVPCAYFGHIGKIGQT